MLVYPLQRRQVGFLVDAAILGFAVGAGFALVENVDYLRALPQREIWLWIVRGFGTAVLHATTAAIMAIAAKSLGDRHPRRGLLILLPGWVAPWRSTPRSTTRWSRRCSPRRVLTLVLPLVVLVRVLAERPHDTRMGRGRSRPRPRSCCNWSRRAISGRRG